jgi:cell division protein FtsQ
MVTVGTVSSTQLKKRRQHLQQQRRTQFWQGAWRSLMIWVIAGGLTWGIARPEWVIQEPQQIKIEGNKLLSAQKIHSLLSLSYPQSLFHIQPPELAQELEAFAPIAEARVERQVFPPGLTVEISERVPVAIAQRIQANQDSPQLGFLDAQGVWIPLEQYSDLSSNPDALSLRVTITKDSELTHWSDFYESIRYSTVKIFAVNWQNPNNLILETELGTVHLGRYTPQLREQLTVLAQMGHLPDHLDYRLLDYIDISDPNSPLIQLKS